MFGTLRLVLAALVLMSHVGIFPSVPGFYWFNHGSMALVGFFILSGYLMKMIFLKRYNNNLADVGAFWKDRWLRIFPHYYFYLILTTLWIFIFKFTQLNWDIFRLFSHISVLPLNFINLLPLQMLEGWPYWALIIPQAWTLASEFQFYLILPFLLRDKRIEIGALVLSLGIFILAAFGVLPTEAYGYRLLAGTLFIFISGGLLYEARANIDNRLAKNILKLIWFGLFILTYFLRAEDKLQVPVNGPVIYGYLFLVPVIWFLSSIKNRRKWDDFLGSLSYGVFLNHYWLIWVLGWMEDKYRFNIENLWIRFLLVLFVSTTLSLISYNLIDKRIGNIRKSIIK